MRTAGIIAEYNPFHNGHAWQIAELKKRGFEAVVCVCSPGVVQRGTAALFPARVRTRAALAAGADLVLSLPAPYATLSAEGFAAAGVALLSALGCVDALCFGTETRRLEDIAQTAALLESPDFPAALRGQLDAGLPLPAARAAAAEKDSTLLHDRVTEEEIARIVGRWTGIPVAKLMEGEREKLLHLDGILHKRVIGQDEAVQRVTEAILRSRAGIADENRPIGSFLFLGPTGVGKTELAKALAEALFDDEKNIVRIDMSEYMEKYSVSRLIGAPPGYVGYEEGGQLTEAVRRKPYSVVLFDEIEKAHPDVFNVLLQVLDDGRITDSQGRTVDFKNTIIILTSNLGSNYILDGIENGEISPEARAQVDALLKTSFRPEFLNRLDEIVYYKPLSKTEIAGVVDLMLESLVQRLAAKQLRLAVTDAAKQMIVDGGYDPVYGARPLKRYIQQKVETLVARDIIQNDPAPGDTITVDVKDGALALV